METASTFDEMGVSYRRLVEMEPYIDVCRVRARRGGITPRTYLHCFIEGVDRQPGR
jgi:hypothetical protein